MTKDSKLITVGVISAAHGIKGDLVVKSFTNPNDNIFQLTLFDKKNQQFSLKKIRTHSKNTIICRNINCSDRNQAEGLIGTELFCKREDLPKTIQNEFYFEDLKDKEVLDINKNKIGIISGVFNFGAGDLIEVRFLHDKNTTIYPFTKEFFPEITDEYLVLSNIYLSSK